MLINIVNAWLLLFQDGWVEEVVREDSIEITWPKTRKRSIVNERERESPEGPTREWWDMGSNR